MLRRLRSEMRTEPDVGLALRRAARDTIPSPRLADVVAFELAVPYYAFFAWKRIPDAPDQFSTHRETAYGSVFAALLMAMGVEIVVAHLIISSLVSETLAWIVTVLSAYGVLWFTADFNAIRRRPMLFGAQALEARIGFRWRASLPYDIVHRVRPFTHRDEADKKRVNLAVFGSPKLVLELDRSVEVLGVYGVKRRARAIGIGVDNADAFRRELEARMATASNR